MKRSLLLAAVSALCAAAADNLGPFEGRSDVGAVLKPGTVEVDLAQKQFTISASGENMWAREDDFHFVWKKASGDVAITASAAFPKPGGNAHRKAILMIRQSLDQDSAYVDAALHGDGLTSLQSRDTQGGLTKEVGTAAAAPTRMRIEKRGDYFTLYMAREGEPLHLAGGSMKLSLTEPFYIGLAVCAHDKNAFETAVFSDVQVETLAPAKTTKLYSTLETVVVTSTDRRVSYVTDARIESPAWSVDGKSLSFLEGGRPKRAVPDSGKAADAQDVPRSGKSAEMTPDGQWIYFASSKNGHIWRMNSEGGEQSQVTSDEFQDFDPHLSPDGKRVAFLSSTALLTKDGDVLLRVMNLADGPNGQAKVTVIAKLIGGHGTLGPGAWSPDGKRLTFVSYQYLPE